VDFVVLILRLDLKLKLSRSIYPVIYKVLVSKPTKKLYST